jgi:outer membrane receptor protein involved in Fe transport
MSATAGAFNIRSARPTAEWEGYFDGEFGNNQTGTVRGAIGGPITDTLGIRVAGKYEDSEGFMKDIVSGLKVGEYEDIGGRVTLQWTPTDNFTAVYKAEVAGIEKFPEARHICLTAGSLIFGRNDPTRASDEGNERSVLAEPPKGEGFTQPVDIDANCFGSNKGISSGGPWFQPPFNIHEENMDTGAIDAIEATDAWNKLLWEQTGGKAGSPFGNKGIEKMDNFNSTLDLSYVFDNGIEINSLSGFSGFKRLNVRDNSDSPFLMNFQDRVELFDQWSTELRVTSPTGGMIEWMVGLFWQDTDYDITSNSSRPNSRRALRYNDKIWEDQEWKSVFATVTFNFLDDRASIDLGGRYVDLDKAGEIFGVAGQWIFDEMPCLGDTDLDHQGLGDSNPATCTPDPAGIQIAAADAAFVLDGADVNNLWIMDYNASRVTPTNWRSPQRAAVGMFVFPNRTVNTLGGVRDGRALRRDPFVTGRVEDGVECCNFDSTEFDPQITLRYRLGNDHSVFARWAEAFKAGGFDTGTTTINRTVDDFRFESESAETYEVGSKGSLWDGRARYDVTLFWTKFNDFQITVPTGNVDDPFLNANAGGQRVRGAEFSFQVAVSDQLTASLAGAWMDGTMTFFPAGGCTNTEARTAPESGCILDDPGDPDEGGTIDRSGETSPKTPDYKFVLGVDYWMPLFNDYKLVSTFKGYISDGYLTDVNGFDPIVKFNKHEDINYTLGFGDMEDTWQFSIWGRNLLGARPTFNEEFDVIPNGLTTGSMSPNYFKTYGVKFRYNFR